MGDINRRFIHGRDRLTEKHEQEVEEFGHRWKEPTALVKYNKPSSQLRVMWSQEKTLALSGDFEAARQLKKRSAKLNAMETRQGQERAEQAMRTEFAKLQRQHELEQLANAHLRDKLVLRAQASADAELPSFDMAIQKLKTMKKQPPVVRASPRVSRSRLVTKREQSFALEDDRPPVLTARTSARLASFRAGQRNDTLPLTEVQAMRHAKSQQQRRRPKTSREEKSKTPKKAAKF